MLVGRTPDGEGKQEEAFELSLEMADNHLEERGMLSEGKVHEASPGVWFVVGLSEGSSRMG